MEIKPTQSQIIPDYSSLVQKPKQYFIQVQGYISNENIVKKKVIVQASTQMTDIKVSFEHEFFPNNKQPDYTKLIVAYKDIGLRNDMTFGKIKQCLGLTEEHKEQTKNISLKIFWKDSKMHPTQIKSKKLVIWVDSNLQQNKKTYESIQKYFGLQQIVSLTQLTSNSDFISLVEENKQYFKFLNGMRDIVFISNMNRPPQFKQEGIQTLKIARKELQHCLFVYYIGNKKKCQQILDNNFSKEQLMNTHVYNAPKELGDFFFGNFMNQKYLNQSALSIDYPQFEQN